MPRVINIARIDRIAAFAVDSMLAWAVVASVAYWVVLLLRLPGKVWFPVCLALVIAALILLRPRNFRRGLCGQGRWSYLLLALCLISAGISAFTSRPDSDDFAFSHRAIKASVSLNQPFSLSDTSHEASGLPPLTPLHVFTSVEVTTALVARILHIPQVLAIHQGLGTLVNFMLPLVYFLLLRFCRVSVPAAVLGAFVVLIAFVVSGNSHRDWGNFTILRSWQGKCILMELMVPLGLLFGLRFTQFGRRTDFLRLHAANIAGIGLSGTGLFLMPFVIGLASLGAWFALRKSPHSAKRVCWVASVLLLPATVAILPWVGLLPKLGDISFYQTGGWPNAYLDNLALVFDWPSVLLYLAVLGIAIVLGRKNPQTGAVFAYLLICAFLILLPGTRDVLMRIVTPGAYWRLAYAFVVPLWAGLAFAAIHRWMFTLKTHRLLVGAVACALVAGTIGAKLPALNRSVTAEPGLKFPQVDLAAAREIAATTAMGAVMLADYRIVTVLGLLRPDIRFIVTRPIDTQIIFTNAGRADEGTLREAIGIALVSCDFSKIDAIQATELWPSMDQIVVPVQCSPEMIRQKFGLSAEWREDVVGSYRRWLR